MARTSFKIRGIEPPDLAAYPPAARKLYWQWVVDLGLRRKDKELSEGLDKDGRPLRPISAETRKHRRSEMTPTGKGSPSAPPLTPGYQKSRTRSLLAGRALTTHAEFFWLYDSHTGDSWGVILADQAAKGRDVFGLSPKGTAWVQSRALHMWIEWKAGNRAVESRARGVAAVAIPRAGQYDTTHATMGIGNTANFGKGQWRGFMTESERKAFYREEKAVNIPGRPILPYNRLLGHVWPKRGPGGAAIPAAKPGPPKPTPRPAVAAIMPRPPAPPGPVGNRVSSAIDATHAPHQDKVKSTLGLIDSVHGTGNAKTAAFPIQADHTPGRQGAFARDRDGNPERITLNTLPDALHPEFTLVHEMGHYLERCLIPGRGVGLADRDYLNDPTIAAWRAAVDGSKAIGTLKRLATQTHVTATASNGNKVTLAVDQKYVQYTLGYNEIWARAYSQWITTRTKDATLTAQLNNERDIAKTGVYHLRQWSDADFEPIGRAMDELFKKIGWMR